MNWLGGGGVVQEVCSRSVISSVEHSQLLRDCSDSGYAGDPDFSPAVSHKELGIELYTFCDL